MRRAIGLFLMWLFGNVMFALLIFAGYAGPATHFEPRALLLNVIPNILLLACWFLYPEMFKKQ